MFLAVLGLLGCAGAIALAVIYGKSPRANITAILMYVAQVILLLYTSAVFIFSAWQLEPMLVSAVFLLQLAVILGLSRDFLLLKEGSNS